MAPVTGIASANTDGKYGTLTSLRKVAEGEGKTTVTPVEKKEPERMLFAKKTSFAAELPKATATETPVHEVAKASAAAESPSFFLSNQQKGETFNLAMVSVFGSKNTTTAGALKDPEKNSGSGDKKEGQNTFLSANKTVQDLRYEKMMESDDILGGILNFA